MIRVLGSERIVIFAIRILGSENIVIFAIRVLGWDSRIVISALKLIFIWIFFSFYI
jgi:hypothetical protein